jgi:hypothetical protein
LWKSAIGDKDIILIGGAINIHFCSVVEMALFVVLLVLAAFVFSQGDLSNLENMNKMEADMVKRQGGCVFPTQCNILCRNIVKEAYYSCVAADTAMNNVKRMEYVRNLEHTKLRNEMEEENEHRMNKRLFKCVYPLDCYPPCRLNVSNTYYNCDRALSGK